MKLEPRQWWFGVVLVTVCGLVVWLGRPAASLGGKEGGGGGTGAGARYSVIETEGSNLVVTDNKTNTVYFYTIDKDAEIGSDLKLRGTIDLTKVGEPTIRPTVLTKKEK